MVPRPSPGLAEGPGVWAPRPSGSSGGQQCPVSQPGLAGPATFRRPLAFRLVGGPGKAQRAGEGTFSPVLPQQEDLRPVSPVCDEWVKLRAPHGVT